MKVTSKAEAQLVSLTSLQTWTHNPINEKLLGAHSTTVNKKLRKAGLLAGRISMASRSKPTVGIYGPSQAGKSYLTAKFAENSEGNLSVKLDKNYDFLKDINPPGGRESTALVSRFTTDKTGSNDDYPIKAKLLNEADIVCILANSYFCDNDEPIYPDADEIANTITELQDQNTSATENNIEDAYQIEAYLDQKIFPREIREKFTSLWDVVDKIYASAPLRLRTQAYCLLWNKNKKFTDLFTRLSETIEKLSGKTEVFLQISSVLPREQSIIDVSILELLGNSEAGHEKILCDEKELTVNKAVLSALIAELYLKINNPQRKVFDSADLLDFPGARTRFQKPITAVEEHGMNEFFLRGKIDYLFQKFTMDLKLDALVFCIDPGPLNVRELPNALEDWLELNNTNNEPTNPNLFFTLTKFDTHFPDAAGNQNDELQRFENALDSGLRQPFARTETSWPLNWNGTTFKNVFPVRNPNYPLHGYFEYNGGIETAIVAKQSTRIDELKKGFLAAPLVLDHIEEAESKWDDLVSVNGGGANYLASALESLDLNSLKDTNLQQQIGKNAHNIIEALSIFIQSDDADERLKKEKSKFDTLFTPIFSIGKFGKFSPLLKSLSVSEKLMATSIKATLQNSQEVEETSVENSSIDDWRPNILRASDDKDGSNSKEEVAKLSQSEQLANAILASWVNALTSGYDNATLSRELNTTLPAFEFLVGHIANEVQIDQIRASLISRLENWTFGLTRDANLGATAKIACQEINQHVLLQKRSDDTRPVTANAISTFHNNETTNPLEKWKEWMNNFGKIIEINCAPNQELQYDQQQNGLLVEFLDKLNAA
jgi:hypothetical protein